MSKWFGRNSGDDGVPETWRADLELSLGPLDRNQQGAARRQAEQVLTGRDPQALAVLGTHSTQVHFPPMFAAEDKASEAASRVLAGLGDVPPEVAVRYAELVATMRRGHLWWSGTPGPGLPGWVPYLTYALSEQVHVPDLRLTVADLEQMVVAAGGDEGALVQAAFEEVAPSYVRGRIGQVVSLLPGWSDAVRRRASVVGPAVEAARGEARLTAIEQLGRLDDETLQIFAGPVSGLATGSSTAARDAARPLLVRLGESAAAPLRAIATTGAPPARALALRVLHETGEGQRAWARERASADRAASVRALLDEWEQADRAPAEEPVTVARPQITWAAEVDPAVTKLMDELVLRLRESEEQRALRQRGGRQVVRTPAEVRRDVDTILRALREGELPPPGTAFLGSWGHLSGNGFERLARRGVGIPTLTLLAAWLGVAVVDGERLSHHLIDAYREAHDEHGSGTLLEISTMLDELGYDGARVVARACCHAWERRIGQDWPAEDVAPFVAANLDAVLEAIPQARDSWHFDALAPYALLGALDPLPSRAADVLLDAALGTRKSDRRAAQDVLSGRPGLQTRVLAALSDGRSEIRMAAAQWLTRLRWPESLDALERAVAKEKQDGARGAMLDALEALGQPVEKYLDREALDREAMTMVAKGLPKDVAWFPWESLPTVRWSDTGHALPLATVQWFLAQAVRSKSPAPNAVLRKYAALVDPADREALGQTVLEAWIAYDLLPIDRAEAEKRATQEAGWLHQSISSHPQYHQGSPHLGRSAAEIAAAMLPAHLRTPRGSAASAKGVLAVAAATAGGGAAPVAQRYLKEWYGTRLSQGKSLIEMLAWIDHPSATQLMLSIGSRFRTKGIQDEANRQATLLAERKGWTVEELADRTIPTAGLDEHGVLELSYGDRVFVARLQPDLTLALSGPDGAPLKSLPAPRVSDDAEAAAAAKKRLTAARKELKAMVTLQSDRLYEALCTGRAWSVEDWGRYLRAHPVVGHLTQRLVWVATTPDGTTTTFRPLDDGTLSGVEDDEVELAEDAVVTLAHDSHLDPRQVRSWLDHLVDYDVAPPFQQLGKGGWQLPVDRERDTEIADFAGHLVESFALRGRADRLGYSRGPSEDGGWFMTYLKRLPTLALEVEVTFSGNYFPEENRTVALERLSFGRITPDGQVRQVRLADVPPVLLSEAYDDLRQMAADGTGFDPDWRKKVQL